jgi:predicted transcriptional regulator
VLLNIVIGEIGTRNLGQFYETSRNSGTFESRLDDISEHQRVLRPCNALSISDATGIPRETVRRKVNALIQRGWVSQNERGHLYLTPEVAQHFENFLFPLMDELLSAVGELAEVFEQPDMFPSHRDE